MERDRWMEMPTFHAHRTSACIRVGVDWLGLLGTSPGRAPASPTSGFGGAISSLRKPTRVRQASSAVGQLLPWPRYIHTLLPHLASYLGTSRGCMSITRQSVQPPRQTDKRDASKPALLMPAACFSTLGYGHARQTLVGWKPAASLPSSIEMPTSIAQ